MAILWIGLIGRSEMEAIHCEALEEHRAQVLPTTILWEPFTGVRGQCTPDKEPCKYQRLLFG